MHTYLFIIGRNPELSIEELLVVCKHIGHIVEIMPQCVAVQGDIDPVALLPKLGGTVKIAIVQETLDSWEGITQDMWLAILRPELRGATGKFHFGFSSYVANSRSRGHLHALGLALKKHLKKIPLSARLVRSKDDVLSSVVVRSNHLIGRELIVTQGRRCYIGTTVAVQDFDSYGLRDYGKPSRNMERGLLPPKLAQIMLNLARVSKTTKLLDPFCGSGTVLEEALLMGLTAAWGSDADSTGIAEAQRNAEWFTHHFKIPGPELAVRDAADLTSQYPEGFFDAIVTEPYLGPARLLHQKRLIRSDLERIVANLSRLYVRFFRSAAMITAPGARAVVVFPIFRLFGQEYMVGDLRTIAQHGWKCLAPEVLHRFPQAKLSSRRHLVYAREDQIVAREIIVWENCRSAQSMV